MPSLREGIADGSVPMLPGGDLEDGPEELPATPRDLVVDLLVGVAGAAPSGSVDSHVAAHGAAMAGRPAQPPPAEAVEEDPASDLMFDAFNPVFWADYLRLGAYFEAPSDFEPVAEWCICDQHLV